MDYEKELVAVVDHARDPEDRITALHGLIIARAINRLALAMEQVTFQLASRVKEE